MFKLFKCLRSSNITILRSTISSLHFLSQGFFFLQRNGSLGNETCQYSSTSSPISSNYTGQIMHEAKI